MSEMVEGVKAEPSDMDRRVRLIFFRADDIIAMFNGIHSDHDYLSLPDLPTLPKGYRVLAVRDDFERNGFIIKVESAEFPPIPEGGKYPYLPDSPPWNMARTAYRLPVKDR